VELDPRIVGTKVYLSCLGPVVDVCRPRAALREEEL
jgi:hypothetical protein